MIDINYAILIWMIMFKHVMASPIVLYQDDDFSITLIRFIATSLLVLAGGFFAGILSYKTTSLSNTYIHIYIYYNRLNPWLDGPR